MVSKNQLHHNVSFALLLCLGLWAFQASSRTLQDNASMHERHEQWMAHYGKVYKDPMEKEKRFRIFNDNVNYIEASNGAGNKLYKLDINQFADLTNEEFIASRNKFKGHMCSSIIRTTTFKYENVTAVPSTVDWRQKGAVTPVKDQGTCGKCLSPLIHSFQYTFYYWVKFTCTPLNYVSSIFYFVRLISKIMRPYEFHSIIITEHVRKCVASIFLFDN